MVCLTSVQRQPNVEFRAVIRFRHGPDSTAMTMDDGLSNGQALAGALARQFGGKEHVEDELHIFGWNAFAGIAHGQLNAAIDAAGGDGDFALA